MNDSNETFLGTEDDTFRILARPSVGKMKELHTKYVADWRAEHDGSYPSTQNLIFAKQHGWTWLEYQRQVAHRRLYN